MDIQPTEQKPATTMMNAMAEPMTVETRRDAGAMLAPYLTTSVGMMVASRKASTACASAVVAVGAAIQGRSGERIRRSAVLRRARVVLDALSKPVLLDAAAERDRTLHAVKHRPVNADVVEDIVGKFNKARLDIHLLRLDVYLAYNLLAGVKNHRRGRNHHGIRFREGNRHPVDLPRHAEVSGPRGVQLRGNILGGCVREVKRAR